MFQESTIKSNDLISLQPLESDSFDNGNATETGLPEYAKVVKLSPLMPSSEISGFPRCNEDSAEPSNTFYHLTF